MPFINQISKHVRSLGQKLTAQNIQNFGTKAMNTAHVIGRKVSNTLHKIENVGNALMPVVQTAATMAGFGPEISAIPAAHNGLNRVSNMRSNVDKLRQLAPH